MTIQETKLLQTPAGLQWREIGVRQHHGLVIPLFSLRTKQSCGVGEFPDLIPLLDWCKTLELDILQLLPLNDGGLDSSPYSAISAYALNPLHLGLSSLLNVDKVPEAQNLLASLQKLSLTQRINYHIVIPERENFLRLYFQHAGSEIISTYDYLLFLSRNPWLESYALFKALKNKTDWQSWKKWPKDWLDTHSNTYKSLLHELKEQMDYHRCVQYLCFKQLQTAKKHAEEKEVFLKGDIPILINRESADVWRHQPLFDLNFAAGAPPDMYSLDGQRWGFPLYNWSNLEQQHYEWWKKRLQVASNLYHLYRVDHIVGFFRIWGIPDNKPAKEGQYIPPHANEWVPHGEKIMRMMLECCPMLPIGEDLGAVPTEVKECLRELGICGTRVMRWERDWDGDKSFIKPQNYPIESMTTVSTHDSETLTLWWAHQPEEAKEFAASKGWTYSPMITREQIKEILWDSHHSSSLFHVNLLQEYLALVPEMTWPDPEDERINVPGIIADTNWSYRFRPFVEEFTSNSLLTDAIKSCLL